MKQGLTQEQLEALCREWQGILRLQDWDVKPELVRRFDLLDESRQGECQYELQLKAAVIRVLRAEDLPPSPWPADLEKTLVHELLHLHFAPFMPEPEEGLRHVAAEQAIELIAEALVRLKRNGE